MRLDRADGDEQVLGDLVRHAAGGETGDAGLGRRQGVVTAQEAAARARAGQAKLFPGPLGGRASARPLAVVQGEAQVLAAGHAAPGPA